MNTIFKNRFPGCAIVSLLIIISVQSCKKGDGSYTYETAVAKKGTIINTITATGTIQADTTVAIGTQVSGVISHIYVDFNSEVHKGELLAVLDTTPLKTQVRQAEASLDDSKGAVEYNKATFERYQALLDKKLVAQADYDQIKYNYIKSLADLKNAKANYDKAIVNLNYATIYAPIKGVILNRAVDQGQTVAASFSTPNLFTIANDLTRMHVEAAIDEADIGQVKPGQPVIFTVDAYPTESFRGDIRQVRLQPIVTSNVVTYTVIVNAPNPDKKLMPGMTANITVLVQKVDSVLTIPGKALRFTPDQAFLTEYMKNNPYRQGQGQRSGPAGSGRPDSTRIQRNLGQGGQPPQGQFGMGQAGQQGSGQGQFDFAAGGQQSKKPVMVWILNDGKIRRTRVATGAIDGTNAEIKWGLKEGDTVVLSMTQAGKTSSASTTATNQTATSPFMPQRPAGGGRGR
ncbi:MAG TPA: efflux RND transporter periplasmic adaptor subunit [Bacteroidales bacterium]|nr:efflux RND transporter periplasmic adaptor subunit [Bacteroidales bacterium]